MARRTNSHHTPRALLRAVTGSLAPVVRPSGPSDGLLHAAGVLPFVGDRVLLGLEQRGWSAFSGTGALGETPPQTAARELSEETARLLYVDGAELAASRCIVTVTPMRRRFHLYLVDMLGAGLGDVAAEFQQRRQCTTEAALREKQRVCWFDLHELERLRLAPSFRADLGRILLAFRTHQRPATAPIVDGSPASQGALDRVDSLAPRRVAGRPGTG
jgi:8-oxo-dGTP pyrophosphatase MutT (NUDIX family)